jgi:DNA-binding NarL/FixJ family response regulator
MDESIKKPARILIVDDHAIVRYGIDVLLSAADDLVLCGEAETISDGLEAVHKLNPDAAVIDIVLKNESGLDLIHKIRNQESEISSQKVRTSTTCHSPPATRHLPILVMSMHNESTHAEQALRAGAQGYVMKENADEVLVEALRTILSGKLYVSDGIHEKMLRNYIGDEEPESSNSVESLTTREKEIFQCLGKGLTTRDMAKKFKLSPRTVEVHRARIKKKLECENAAQLLRTAVQWVESNA